MATLITAEQNFNISSFHNNYDDLPFPMYLNSFWKIVIVISLLITLNEGTRLRAIIIQYIRAPETKLGPINYLICLDQLDGLFLAILILIRILFILSPVPVSQIFGSNFCYLTEFIGGLVLGGTVYWSCCIAVFRVIFVKAQNWLQNKIGVKNLLTFMVGFGVCQLLVFGYLLVQFDDESSLRKSCFHQSNFNSQILIDAQVSLYHDLIFLYKMI